MKHTCKLKGVCSGKVDFEIIDGKVTNIAFTGGCNGNASGIAALAEGMTPEEIVNRLSGIKCGFKTTSCPDQLAKAIDSLLKK